jgi:hypothetical protein
VSSATNFGSSALCVEVVAPGQTRLTLGLRVAPRNPRPSASPAPHGQRLVAIQVGAGAFLIRARSSASPTFYGPSCGVEEALAEQPEAGAPVHLALEHLEAVDLAFGLTVAPRQGDRGVYGGPIAAKSLGEVA